MEGRVRLTRIRPLLYWRLLTRSLVLMPPSALARLTTLNFPSPWMFQLRNPENAAASTHAGVLEFIADEGTVFLPPWVGILLAILLYTNSNTHNRR